MATVIAAVNGLLYIFGYPLNTITLFALILSLSLIVSRYHNHGGSPGCPTAAA